MAEADIQAIIDTPNGDTSWGADLRGAMTTINGFPRTADLPTTLAELDTTVTGAQLDALKSAVDNDLQADLSGAVITSVAAAVNDELLMQDTSNSSALRTVTPGDLMDVWVTSGSGAPVQPPFRTGLMYLDTGTSTFYVSTGTASSADWDQILGARRLLDEDTMSSNDATRPASQQSVKAYVDSLASSQDGSTYAITHNASGALDLDFSDTNHGWYVTASANITSITWSNGATAGNMKARTLFLDCVTSSITITPGAGPTGFDPDIPTSLSPGDSFAVAVLNRG